MKTKRIAFLSSHLRNLNRSVSSERKRFWRLYPLALLVCGFGFGSVYRWEKQAVAAFEKASPVSDPSETIKTRSSHAVEQKRGVSTGISQTWIGETRSGEPIRETPAGISFRF